MNIIVCIKQVPDTSEIRIDPETNTLIRQGVPSIINPFDENAIEEAVRLKERYGGKVTVITMGPPQAEDALREAIARGADEAILISDRAFAGADTLATAKTLSAAIKKIGEYDIIFFGKQAIDGDTAQVGPGVSEFLGIEQITYVRKVHDVNLEAKKIKVERTVDNGFEVVETTLPVTLTALKELNEPRFPSIKGKMKAKKMEIPKWGIEELGLEKEEVGLKGSPTRVVKTFTPKVREKGEIIEGESIEEKVSHLVTRLRNLNLL